MKKHVLMASAAVLALGLATPAFAGNDSMIDQIGSNNTAWATQSGGAANSSGIYQGTSTTDATDSQAYVTQSGTGENTSGVEQTGDNNYALINQIGAGGANYSDVTQADGDNSAIVTQTSSADDTNDSTVTQNGSNGTATITQGAGDNDSDVTQDGAWNTATVTQDAAGGIHQSTIIQTGDGADLVQANSATVTQTGTDDYSYVSQSGNSNTAYVTQD